MRQIRETSTEGVQMDAVVEVDLQGNVVWAGSAAAGLDFHRHPLGAALDHQVNLRAVRRAPEEDLGVPVSGVRRLSI